MPNRYITKKARPLYSWYIGLKRSNFFPSRLYANLVVVSPARTSMSTPTQTFFVPVGRGLEATTSPIAHGQVQPGPLIHPGTRMAASMAFHHRGERLDIQSDRERQRVLCGHRQPCLRCRASQFLAGTRRARDVNVFLAR
ncbi:hypothetical protein HJFPF1_02362 [Paramyrothecium foliicola]|nr:hypothetical protein HJFPF1_02362 [Paramyrothecium foliicola]